MSRPKDGRKVDDSRLQAFELIKMIYNYTRDDGCDKL